MRSMIVLHHLMNVLGPVIVAVIESGDRRMHGSRETPHVLDGERAILSRPQVLIQDGENLRIQYLKATNTIYHSLQMLQKEI